MHGQEGGLLVATPHCHASWRAMCVDIGIIAGRTALCLMALSCKARASHPGPTRTCRARSCGGCTSTAMATPAGTMTSSPAEGGRSHAHGSDHTSGPSPLGGAHTVTACRETMRRPAARAARTKTCAPARRSAQPLSAVTLKRAGRLVDAVGQAPGVEDGRLHCHAYRKSSM
jgi:hypothetical protein